MDATPEYLHPARGVNQTARLIAAGGGLGYTPGMPGTAAAAAAACVGSGLLLLPAWALAGAVAVSAFGGYWAVRAARVQGDPGWVVIDEIAGQFVALLGLAHPTAIGVFSGFVLFRVLDIAKPGPVGWADRQSGAFGIMADDLIAGLIAAGVLLLLRTLWPAAFN